jgi:hypothetical protein
VDGDREVVRLREAPLSTGGKEGFWHPQAASGTSAREPDDRWSSCSLVGIGGHVAGQRPVRGIGGVVAVVRSCAGAGEGAGQHR